MALCHQPRISSRCSRNIGQHYVHTPQRLFSSLRFARIVFSSPLFIGFNPVSKLAVRGCPDGSNCPSDCLTLRDEIPKAASTRLNSPGESAFAARSTWLKKKPAQFGLRITRLAGRYNNPPDSLVMERSSNQCC